MPTWSKQHYPKQNVDLFSKASNLKGKINQVEETNKWVGLGVVAKTG